MQLLQRIANIIFFINEIYCCFLNFLSRQENLYMIQLNLDLFYGICNITNEHDKTS